MATDADDVEEETADDDEGGRVEIDPTPIVGKGEKFVDRVWIERE